MHYRITTQESIFFLIYIIYLSAVLGDLTIFSENDMCSLVFKGMRYLCYIFAIIKVLRDAYCRKCIFEVIVLVLCVACTVLSSENRAYGFYFLMILAAKDINAHKILKLTCYVQGLCLALCIGLSQIGVIQDFLFDSNARQRHGLGFLWTTTAPILFFFFMMSYIYLRKEKMHTLEFIILEVINYWLYTMTDARMSFYLSSLMLLFLYVMRFYWKNRSDIHFINILLILSPIIMCCIALFLHAGYDSSSERWNSLNSFLSGRLALGYNGIEKYGITLFGQPVRWIGFGHGSSAANYNYVDCSYLQILLENGIITLVIVVLVYVYIMYMAVKVKDFYLQTIILVIVTFSITEPRLMNLGFNAFPFLAAGFFSGAKGEKVFQKHDRCIWRIKWRVSRVSIKKRK